MTKTNETISTAFGTRAEALAYRDGVRMLADLFPERDIRISGPWEAEIDGRRWRIYVRCHGAA